MHACARNGVGGMEANARNQRDRILSKRTSVRPGSSPNPNPRLHPLRRLHLRPPHQLPATTSQLQRLQSRAGKPQVLPGSRMGPLWHPRKQHLAGVYGHRAERRAGPCGRARGLAKSLSMGEDGGPGRADRGGGHAVRESRGLYHWSRLCD